MRALLPARQWAGRGRDRGDEGHEVPVEERVGDLEAVAGEDRLLILPEDEASSVGEIRGEVGAKVSAHGRFLWLSGEGLAGARGQQIGVVVVASEATQGSLGPRREALAERRDTPQHCRRRRDRPHVGQAMHPRSPLVRPQQTRQYPCIVGHVVAAVPGEDEIEPDVAGDLRRAHGEIPQVVGDGLPGRRHVVGVVVDRSDTGRELVVFEWLTGCDLVDPCGFIGFGAVDDGRHRDEPVGIQLSRG